MYNSSYGGIESDGIMSNLRQEQFIPQNNETSEAVFKQNGCDQKGKKGIFGSSFLKNIETDDLILIGILIFLLLDKKEGDADDDNNIFLILIIGFVLLSDII